MVRAVKLGAARNDREIPVAINSILLGRYRASSEPGL